MADTERRAAALSAAVALTVSHLEAVEVDREILTEGLTDRQVADAAVWLARLLAEHAALDTGPMMLRVIGQVVQWVAVNEPGGRE